MIKSVQKSGVDWVLQKAWCLLILADITGNEIEEPKFNEEELTGLFRQTVRAHNQQDLEIVESALEARYPGALKEMSDTYLPERPHIRIGKPTIIKKSDIERVRSRGTIK